MMDTIFTCLQGFFVAIVFFSDPAMSSYMTERWTFCKQKYIDDFSQVQRYSDGHVEILQIKRKSSGTIQPSVRSCQQIYFQHDKLTTLDIDLLQVSERRLSIPQSVYLRVAHPHTIDFESPPSTSASTLVESGIQTCQCMTDPDSQKRILVPYKYPRLASIIHWVLVKCGVHHTQSNENEIQFLSVAHNDTGLNTFETVNSIHPATRV